MAKVITDLSKEFNPADKPQHKRNKPTRRQRGDISPRVRKQLHERSKGVCERCYKARGQEAAHTLRRLDIRVRTTVEDLARLCKECHIYCDSTIGGKVFKQQFRLLMYKRAGRMHEYYE